MRAPFARPRGRDRRRAQLVIVGLLVALALDSLSSVVGREPPIAIVRLEFFAALWAGIQALAGFLGTGAAAAAGYLAEAVAWLARRVASILLSTGAIFSKVWEGLRIVWSDVLRPFLHWVDTWIKRIHDWLVRTFRPILEFLKCVRERILKLYERFVRPVLDVIEFVKAINRLLLAFHVHLLEGLDRILTQIENRLEEPILWVLAQLTKVQNVIDAIVDEFGLFQRYTLIKSMGKYAFDWTNGFWNVQIDPNLRAGTDYDRGRAYPSDDAISNGLELGRYYRGEPNRMQVQVIDLVSVFRQSSGLDAPTFLEQP